MGFYGNCRSIWKLKHQGETTCVASVRMSGSMLQECPSANSSDHRCTTVRIEYVTCSSFESEVLIRILLDYVFVYNFYRRIIKDFSASRPHYRVELEPESYKENKRCIFVELDPTRASEITPCDSGIPRSDKMRYVEREFIMPLKMGPPASIITMTKRATFE